MATIEINEPSFSDIIDNNSIVLLDFWAQSFNIRSIPTTIAFKEGIGVFMQPGALPEEALRDLVEKISELDMDEVRAELKNRKASEESEE